jgi:DNA-binding beta-propeller fold protein YncE
MLYSSGKHTYEIVDHWAKCPKGWSLGAVSDVSIDSQDRVYLFTRGDHPVTVFDREGNILTSWGEGLFKITHGIHAGSDGSVYCTDVGNHTVSKFTPEGKLLLVLGNKDQPSDTGFTGFVGIEPNIGFYEELARVKASLAMKKRVAPPFNRPTGVFVSSSGEIYVSDGYGNARIHKFSPDGTLLFSWGELGNGPGQFICPHSVWIDKQQRVWVTDRDNYRIQIFSTQGKFLSQWRNLALPCVVVIDNEETVYVPEPLGQRLSIFTIDGNLLARWYNQEEKNIIPFTFPHGTAVDSEGNLYVANVGAGVWTMDQVSGSNIVKFARRS